MLALLFAASLVGKTIDCGAHAWKFLPDGLLTAYDIWDRTGTTVPYTIEENRIIYDSRNSSFS